MLNLINILFKRKSNHWFVQLFRYGFVGGFAAIVDIASLYAFTDVLHIHYLISAALAFMLGTVVNYLLSIAWVFKSSGRLKAEITVFTLIGMGGLLLNELIIWLLVERAHIFYLTAKLVSVSIVMIWSFTLRRMLFNNLNVASK